MRFLLARQKASESEIRCRMLRANFQYIRSSMDHVSLWLTSPADAYREWQQTDAVGSDRRPFSERSRIQHAAMFDRFLRHLLTNNVTLATFDGGHVQTFLTDVESRSTPGTTTRLRYGKTLDRLCRRLVENGIRQDNPVSAMAAFERWPEDEPEPLYLDVDADARLQQWVLPLRGDDARMLRNRAIVALFLGGGLPANELRLARSSHLFVVGSRPHIEIPKRGSRDSRKVLLPSFAIVPLSDWQAIRAKSDIDSLLFPAPRGSGPVNDALLGKVVNEALEAIGFRAPDMSPRVLRNTYARRQLMSGRSNDEVARALGLASHRTVVRVRATLGANELSRSAVLG